MYIFIFKSFYIYIFFFYFFFLPLLAALFAPFFIFAIQHMHIIYITIYFFLTIFCFFIYIIFLHFLGISAPHILVHDRFSTSSL